MRDSLGDQTFLLSFPLAIGGLGLQSWCTSLCETASVTPSGSASNCVLPPGWAIDKREKNNEWQEVQWVGWLLFPDAPLTCSASRLVLSSKSSSFTSCRSLLEMTEKQHGWTVCSCFPDCYLTDPYLKCLDQEVNNMTDSHCVHHNCITDNFSFIMYPIWIVLEGWTTWVLSSPPYKKLFVIPDYIVFKISVCDITRGCVRSKKKQKNNHINNCEVKILKYSYLVFKILSERTSILYKHYINFMATN